MRGYGQSIEQARADGREERRFWSWDESDYRIVEVSGFAGPNSHEDGYWWVPELGASMCVGHHLFPTQQEASSAASAKLTDRISSLEALRANI